MSKKYTVVLQQIYTMGEYPNQDWKTAYDNDGIMFDTRAEAIDHGFEIRESDDFNIAVIENNKLLSFDWMGSPVGEDESTLAEIAESLGVKS